ncbi:FapA family protein [Desulfobacula phenolica]|uniref:Flagellar Assembly Protein A N-terminal region domain-containing protein n=1 Tax=Desulfobacula phenolica TaxID=90732 RepID=A0A1H2IYM7_9BACT|nr:FapA family protein [Desulfobacula phenolica]SDU49081.1 hypothetical protein SAMN04487931_1105 [Desulfobacula phenolica]
MEQSNQIPSLAELALKYGTINDEQFNHVRRLYALKRNNDNPIGYEKLLLSQKFITRYQVGLLKLIQEYLVVRKQGETFGQIAVEQGFVSQDDVDRALEMQKKEFRQSKIKKLIGDILVESRVLTLKQKNEILKEQDFLDTRARKTFTTDPSKRVDQDGDRPIDQDIDLSDYEKQFLKTKVLDQEFAACVIEKGFCSKREVKIAQKVQADEFEKEKKIRILGDIMVELNYLTKEQRNLILKEQEQIKKNSGFVTDSGVHVHIGQDQMEAVVKISKEPENVCLQDIKDALETKGVKYGVYTDAILQCNLDLKNNEFVAAKQGLASDVLTNKNVLYHFDTGKTDTEPTKKGALLAEQRLEEGTYLKKNVFGNNIEQPKAHDLFFRCASGTRFLKDNKNAHAKAFAVKTGFVCLSVERKLYIHSTINVLEDADLRYGPLENYANLNISGVLTGAYPITAGQVNAREIRGARIVATGNVKSHVGITDAVISAQGDIHAAYLHNCRIETFGNVYIANEIIDSHIFCSGKINSGQCRVISSILYAKKGIELAGAGNNRTKACILGAGSEHHILKKAGQINLEIKNISRHVDELKEKKDDQERSAKKTFQKMVELKIFHDRAKNKKQKLAAEFKRKNDVFKKENLKNIAVLINNFEKRMISSISLLKELNKTKKEYEKQSAILEKKIKNLEPEIKRKIFERQMDLAVFFEWTKKQKNNPQIKINHKAFPGTLLKGIFSSLEIEKEMNGFLAFETPHSTKGYQMAIQKN